MILEELINLPDFDRTWTFQQTFDYVNADVVVEDHTMYSIRYLPSVFPDNPDACKLVCNTMYLGATNPQDFNAYMLGMWSAFNGEGLDFANPETQAQIDKLAVGGQWPDAVRDAMKAIGIKTKKYWESLGVTQQPTLQRIASAMVSRQIGAMFNGIQQQVSTGGIAIDGNSTSDSVAKSIIADFVK